MGWSGSGVDASYVDQLEPVGLDLLEDAVESGLVDDPTREDGLCRGGRDGQVVEGLDEGRPEPAADGDCIVRWLHALSVRRTRMTRHRTMGVTGSDGVGLVSGCGAQGRGGRARDPSGRLRPWCG